MDCEDWDCQWNPLLNPDASAVPPYDQVRGEAGFCQGGRWDRQGVELTWTQDPEPRGHAGALDSALGEAAAPVSLVPPPRSSFRVAVDDPVACWGSRRRRTGWSPFKEPGARHAAGGPLKPGTQFGVGVLAGRTDHARPSSRSEKTMKQTLRCLAVLAVMAAAPATAQQTEAGTEELSSELPSRETECTGRIDDDGDGLTDCADSDCYGRARVPGGRKPGGQRRRLLGLDRQRRRRRDGLLGSGVPRPGADGLPWLGPERRRAPAAPRGRGRSAPSRRSDGGRPHQPIRRRAGGEQRLPLLRRHRQRR